MCTSLTYLDTDNHRYFARTMDFPTTTPWRPIFAAPLSVANWVSDDAYDAVCHSRWWSAT